MSDDQKNPWLDQTRRRIEGEVRAAWARNECVFMRTPADLAADRWREADDARDGKHSPISFGIPQVDLAIDTLAGSKLMVVLGRPSEGKSLLLYQLAREKSREIIRKTQEAGKPWYEYEEYVLFVGMEESGAEISRLVAGDTHSAVDLHSGQVTHEVLRERASAALETPLYVLNETRADVWGAAYQSATLTGEAIWEEIQAMYRATGRMPGLVLVDYLQLLGLEASDQRHEVAKNARALRQLSRDLRVPVVLASQARRVVDSASREGYPPIPEVGDSEWSAVPEQACDILASLTRPARWPDKLQTKLGGKFAPYRTQPGREYDITEGLVLFQLLKQKGRPGRRRFMLQHDFGTNMLRLAKDREGRA